MHDGHEHVHDERMETEQKAVDAEADDAERSRLTTALVKVWPCTSSATEHHIGCASNRSACASRCSLPVGLAVSGLDRDHAVAAGGIQASALSTLHTAAC